MKENKDKDIVTARKYWRFIEWFTKEKKVAFLSCIIFGFVTYLVLMINQSVCADPVLFLDYFKSSDWQNINQGRWSTNIFYAMRGYIVDPVLSTSITIFSNALVAVLFVDLFQIENKIAASLIGIALAVHPYVANAMMYYSTSGTLFSVLPLLAVFIIYRTNLKYWIKIVIATVLYTIVLGYSQSYICTMCTVALSIFLCNIVEREKKAWNCLVCNVISCGVSCVLYMLVWKILIKINNVSILYGGAENYSIQNFLKNFWGSIKKIYSNFYEYFMGDSLIHNSYWNRQFMNCAIIIVVLVNLMLFLRKAYISRKIGIKDILIVIAGIFCFPIATIMISMIATEYNFYLMMANAFIFVIPLLIKFGMYKTGGRIWDRICPKLTLVLSIVIIWTFILSDIAGYRLLDHTFVQTKELASRILMRIENVEGFTYDMPVCFIGQPDTEAFSCDDVLYRASPGGTFSQQGVFPGIWENSDGWGLYIYRYCGVKLNYYSNGMQNEIRRLAETEEFANRECYPARDSIGVIDGVLVVKLGEYDSTLPD